MEIGLFDIHPDEETNPLLIDVFEDESKVQSNLNNIYRPVAGGTELLRAIRSGKQTKIEGLLNVYQQDFNKIRDYLVTKYQCDPEDRIWLKKINLVAVDEEQCRSVKCFERNSNGLLDLKRAIFVLLLSPIDGEEVAVLHPNSCNHLELFGIIWRLLPNGSLDWNNAEVNGQCQTFVEAAAARGNNNAIRRMLTLGAQISPPNHNPLIAACSSLRKDTIRYLLTDNFDKFDFTQRNHRMNAFFALMLKNDTELLDYVLEKMIHYRQTHYQDSQSQAFNHIFLYRNEEYPSSSILACLRPGTMRDKIESYIEKYELDLPFQLKDFTTLSILLTYNLAPKYCQTGIQKNPKLLGLQTREETTVLHECIKKKMFDFLAEIYVREPEVKKYFETDRSYELLQEALVNNLEDSVTFMLENHGEFFSRNLENFEDFLLNIRGNIYERNGTLLLKHFPELKNKIMHGMAEEHRKQISEGHVKRFREITEKLKYDPTDITTFQHHLDEVRGPQGETVLHFAVETDNLKLSEILLRLGCNLDTLDNEGNHPVHCVRGLDMLDLIIQDHPEGRCLLHRTNSTGQTLFHKICSDRIYHKPLTELLKKIIEYGANVNQLTNSGESAPFMTSCPSVFQLLIGLNANLETVNNSGETVLQRHLCYQHCGIARTLLPLLHQLPSFKDHAHKYLAPLVEAKRYTFKSNYRPFLEANPDTTKLMFDSLYEHSRYKASQLFNQACCRARSFFVDKFLQYNYDLDFNLKDEYGYTPIMGLLCNCREEPRYLLERLLKKNVDLELRNQHGQSVLAMIVDRGYGFNCDTVKMLLDHGANVNAADDNGNTALHLAFKHGKWELIEFLVRNGGDLTIENKDGNVPCEMGISLYREIFRFMR